MVVRLVPLCWVSLLTKRLYSKMRYQTTSTTLSFVRKWGPSTRNMLHSVPFENTHILESEANDATRRVLAAASSSIESTLPRSEGSSLVFTRRKADSFYFHQAVHFIPTPHLIDIFDSVQQTTQDTNALNLFNMLSSHSFTRTKAGWLHELSMHRCLSRGPRTLKVFQDPNSSMRMTPSTNLLPGTLRGLKIARDRDFYWLPSVVNFPGVDSVLGDSSWNLFTLQATIAGDHKSPQEGITKVWENLSPAVRNGRIWHYVTVTRMEADAEKYRAQFSESLENFRLGRDKPTRVWVCSCVLHQ